MVFFFDASNQNRFPALTSRALAAGVEESASAWHGVVYKQAPWPSSLWFPPALCFVFCPIGCGRFLAPRLLLVTNIVFGLSSLWSDLAVFSALSYLKLQQEVRSCCSLIKMSSLAKFYLFFIDFCLCIQSVFMSKRAVLIWCEGSITVSCSGCFIWAF